MEPAADERTVRVSTLELFFDLVFVFTLTQLTGLLADDPTWAGLAKVVLLLSVIWWIYDGYVWLTNTVALDVLGHRLLLLGGMAGFLLMALAIPTMFDDGGVAFGLGYLAVVSLHGWLYLRATSASEAEAIRGIVPYNLAAALMLVAAGLTDGVLMWALVVAPAVLLWFVPYVARMEGFQVAASHFVERHGLVVIVALGESIVVLGAGAGGAEVGLELGLIAILGLALSAALWWTYFSHEEELEHAMLATPPSERPQRGAPPRLRALLSPARRRPRRRRAEEVDSRPARRPRLGDGPRARCRRRDVRRRGHGDAPNAAGPLRTRSRRGGRRGSRDAPHRPRLHGRAGRCAGGDRRAR